jgi:hypothetical protein
MATDFPNSPANGATHTFGGTVYTYSTSVGAWTAGSSAGGASVTVSETAPSSPAEGDLWFDPSVLKTFVYYNDGTANQWVQNNPTGSGGSGGGGASVTASDTAPSSPSAGDLWYKSDTNALYVYYNDGDSSQWVGVSGPAGAAGAAGAAATGYGQVPIVYTEPATTHNLNKDGSTSTVQMQAVDPEGTSITYAIAYANATNARPNQLAADTAINQSTGTFTFDPSTNNAHAGSFKARLSASDGITHATRFVDFNLAFTVDVEYLVIAGGGGGAGGTAGAGGGGAGGYRTGTGLSLTSGTTYAVTVGAGGTGNPTSDGVSASSTDGGDSVFSTITATGGGGGQGGNPVAPYAGIGRDGGSGGGGRYGGAGGSGNTPSTTPSQGNDGGASTSAGSRGGGGGGGAGGTGADGTSGTGGAGGAGLASSITGSSVVRASGGAGGNTGSNTVAATAGGGGAGGTSGNSTAGAANTGGGGGGNGSGAGGKDGGSGVVIIAAQEAATTVTGTYTVDTSGRSGWHVYTFTAGTGSITF